MKKFKIFVSYSHEDRDILLMLKKGLSNHLSRKEGIEYNFFTDYNINMGAYWKSVIDKSIYNSDAALLLVSASFAASPFIQNEELSEFLKLKKSKNFLILPVLIRKYDFSEFKPLAALNFFKTYQNEYGFFDPIDRNKFMHFDKLAENARTSEGQLNDYYYKLADYIHTSVKEYISNTK